MIPTVVVPYSPEVLDVALRSIYPVATLPEVADLLTLIALFSVVDKYNIVSAWPILGLLLKTLLPADPFVVYVVSHHYGLLEEAKEAAMVSTPRGCEGRDNEEVVRLISSSDLRRLIHFVRSREKAGRSIIQEHGWSPLGRPDPCRDDDKHWNDVEGLYARLATVVKERFIRDPCVGLGDLIKLTYEIPGPYNCEQTFDVSPGRSLIFGVDKHKHKDRFLCPLDAARIEDSLVDLVRDLGALNREMLAGLFEKGTGSG